MGRRFEELKITKVFLEYTVISHWKEFVYYNLNYSNNSFNNKGSVLNLSSSFTSQSTPTVI